MKIDIKKLENSKIEINVEIDLIDFEREFQIILEKFKKTTIIQGFRKGKAPENIVIQNIGEMRILNEAAENIINKSYRKIIKDNNLEPLGSPEINIVKIARKNPFVFNLSVFLYPEIKISDYEGNNLPKIEKSLDLDVKEEEIEETLNYIRKSRAQLFEKGSDLAEKGDFVEIEYNNVNDDKISKDSFLINQDNQSQVNPFEKEVVGMKKNEIKIVEVEQKEKEGEKLLKFKVKLKEVKRVEFPEINDEFIKSLGNFKNLEDFKANIKEGLKKEKVEAEKQGICYKFLEKISEKTKIDIPEILIKSEQTKMFDNFKKNIEKEISFDEYLKKTDKKEEDFLMSFVEQAKIRVTNFLFLKEITKKQKIIATENEIQKKTQEIIQYYGLEEDIDKKQINKYAEEQIKTQKTFDYIYSLYS